MKLVARLQQWPLWDFFFPPICSLCEEPLGKNEVLFCGRCFENCELARPADLPSCKQVDRPSVAFVMHHHAEDPARALIHALKYDGHRILASRISRAWARCIPRDFLEPKALWIPVPQHWLRGWQRGFSQSLILTKGLEQELGISVETKLLQRVRPTRTQVHLNPQQRRKNVRGAFRVSKKVPLPKRVILVDDVITTGATVEECALTLKIAGVKWVGAVAFARARP